MSIDTLFFIVLSVIIAPVFLSWLIIILGPISFMGVAGSSAAYSYLNKSYLSVADNFGELKKKLEQLFFKLDHPQKVCACYQQKNGETFLAAQYISKDGTFSHQVKAANVNEALLKLSSKIRGTLNNNHRSSTNYRCVAFNHCPNRINSRKPYSEVYFRTKSDKLSP